MYLKGHKKTVRLLLCAASCLMLSGAAAMSAFADAAQENAQTQEAEQNVISTTGQISSCTIDTDKTNVTLTMTSNAEMAGTDGKIYLVEMKNWQDDLTGRTDYLASQDGASQVSFHFPLNADSTDDRRYSSFIAAVWDTKKQEYKALTPRYYITNPEIMAKDQSALRITGKKGLSIEFSLIEDAMNMGIKQAEINIPVNFLYGNGVDYTYKGQTYHFAKSWLDTYDRVIKTLSGRGVVVTAVILNGWNANDPDMFLPGTAKSSDPYYMFNTKTEAGQRKLEAAANFLAERYNGSNGHGRLSNWVIGNEINNQYWNHTGAMDVRSYVELYQKAYRTFYAAVKSQNAHSNVLFSIDYYWNDSSKANGSTYYKGKDVLDQFNSVAAAEGPIDWGIAYHPYPYPMNDPVFWDDGSQGLTDSITTPILNFYNLHVLTDYMQSSELRAPDGNVRHIFLTEQGFTSTTPSGEKLKEQAAAYAYSYYLVESNPYIEGYNLARQIDAPSEVNDGISFGLFYCDMNQPNNIVAYHSKPIYYVFKDIDVPSRTLSVSKEAKQTLGISKWSELIPHFKWSGLE